MGYMESQEVKNSAVNCTSKPKRKSRALFSSVDSPSWGKRCFVQLICVVLRKCMQTMVARLPEVRSRFSVVFSILFN